jgi:serine/threonine-protein kinase/endoribonuclease IRE1
VSHLSSLLLWQLLTSPGNSQKHHYQDLPEAVRTHLGDLPNGFLTYFTSRFPRLLLHVYETVSIHLADETMFLSTFQIQDEEQ